MVSWCQTLASCLVLTDGKEGEERTSKSRACAWGTRSCPSGFANDPNGETQYCPQKQEVVHPPTNQHAGTPRNEAVKSQLFSPPSLS